MYPLSAINRRLVEIISACYSNNGKIGAEMAVYPPYSSNDKLLCNDRVSGGGVGLWGEWAGGVQGRRIS